MTNSESSYFRLTDDLELSPRLTMRASLLYVTTTTWVVFLTARTVGYGPPGGRQPPAGAPAAHGYSLIGCHQAISHGAWLKMELFCWDLLRPRLGSCPAAPTTARMAAATGVFSPSV